MRGESAQIAAGIADALHSCLVTQDREDGRPETYHLAQEIWPQFRLKIQLYREAVLLLALLSKCKDDPRYESILDAYEILIFPSGESPERRIRLGAMEVATESLSELLWPKMERMFFEWSMEWFAKIGHKETNPATLAKSAFSWRSVYLMAGDGL